ncbi:50S ribosomal protein L21 [Buchnera aphidicola (Pterocallis alni)]|uniref:50S ribosomal protein L21 n=1 Tax=Buchnera aphidicola TaxID=9 RepID=UPI003464ACC2
MYAIFAHSGKQYQVKEGETVRVEKINLEQGKKITFSEILMVIQTNQVFIGEPTVHNSYIHGYILKHGKHKKIKIFKFSRRKHYKKKQGHRQHFTDVKIVNISMKH